MDGHRTERRGPLGRGASARRMLPRRPPRGHRLTRKLARADLRAVGEARHALRELLDRHGQEASCADTAELLTSELVTNALVHTADDAVLTAVVRRGRLRVEVRDQAKGVPRARTAVPEEQTGGRGLGLVQTLADAWGVRAVGAGKAVWFELETGAVGGA
ncbi:MULTISPECIES: ATP-binding protein [unclassified Streptomyces]|uniref:ATP-binding protein n=2 Tax=unclassified Streptomyces TaxID=2593676 RepID=UPI0004C4FC80|nr:ATP-binding protein [Streptomyces sp. NRRL F-5630]